MFLETINFKNISELGHDVEELYYEILEEFDNEDTFYGVSVVAHYDIIVELTNWLVKVTSFELKNIKLEEGVCCGYGDEWILTIDEDGYIWVQEAKYDTGYVYDCSDVIYVHGDVNSAFTIKNKESNMIMFEIADDDECSCECCKYNECVSTEKSNHTYRVNGKEVSKEEYDDKLDNLLKKFNDWFW